MGTCNICGKSSVIVSEVLGFCVDCIRKDFESVWPYLRELHTQSRKRWRLPSEPPKYHDGKACNMCIHGCRIREGETGYCGVRRVEGGRFRGGGIRDGNLYYYFDPLPTNCVASFVCPGSSGCGYPEYSVSSGAEYGYKNLAVFYHACSFNCLFCQNFHFKEQTFRHISIDAETLSDAIDEYTTCICFFGGDPTCQILHSIESARLAIKKAKGRPLRICWETNGSVNKRYLIRMAELAYESGGCIKIDLKAWNESVHKALCGVSNKRTIENIILLSEIHRKRREIPLLIVSTLLVPGYVDEEEIRKISEFLASLDPHIPYSLLAFYPCFVLNDLPTTSKRHAMKAKEIAQKAGIKKVHIGNLHLLSEEY